MRGSGGRSLAILAVATGQAMGPGPAGGLAFAFAARLGAMAMGPMGCRSRGLELRPDPRMGG